MTVSLSTLASSLPHFLLQMCAFLAQCKALRTVLSIKGSLDSGLAILWDPFTLLS